ncbi:MAG: hypothetical protein PUE95_04235 [Lachnospiraceae bacterium]|nr:hypothetical protein [Lachnospiraceae bacterium]
MIEKEREFVQELRSLIDEIKIEQKHKEYMFMCPKHINNHMGFIMYLYGGAAFTFELCHESWILADYFGHDYCKYFISEKRGEEIRKEIKRIDKKTEKLVELDEEFWDEICNAFHMWVLQKNVGSEKRRKRDYERMRQTRICQQNAKNDTFTIFDMEEKISLSPSDAPEVDMIAIHHNEEEDIISYIEYKCTDHALSEGKTKSGKEKPTLAVHYKDMVKYYQDDLIAKRSLELYKWSQWYENKQVSIYDASHYRKEIIFLFSNIKWKKGSPALDPGKEVFVDTIYRRLQKTVQLPDFSKHENKVKIIILGDADTDDVVINSEMIFSVEEANDKFSINIMK